MEHFNSILFHKTEPANKQHTNQSINLRLSFPKDLFSVGLPVIILKALLTSSILATIPAHLNLLDLITLTILAERYKL